MFFTPVKTVVNAAGDDDGRATLSFERPLYYPSVSLYQLQTQSLHLTICGRNVTTTRSFPIATTCIPLMIAIKQHQPTWYQLSYNPDLITGKQELTAPVQESWEKGEGQYLFCLKSQCNKTRRNCKFKRLSPLRIKQPIKPSFF